MPLHGISGLGLHPFENKIKLLALSIILRNAQHFLQFTQVMMLQNVYYNNHMRCVCSNHFISPDGTSTEHIGVLQDLNVDRTLSNGALRAPLKLNPKIASRMMS